MTFFGEEFALFSQTGGAESVFVSSNIEKTLERPKMQVLQQLWNHISADW